MYLFSEYVFRESVESARNSQISSTFQEADCLLKLVKVNNQVFAITLLSRNLNHTAQVSISAKGEIIILSVGLGGGEEMEKTQRKDFHYRDKSISIAEAVSLELHDPKSRYQNDGMIEFQMNRPGKKKRTDPGPCAKNQLVGLSRKMNLNTERGQFQ